MAGSHLFFQGSLWVLLENEQGDRVGDSQSSEEAPTGASEQPGPPLQPDHGTPEGRELALLGAQHMARLRKHALSEPLTSPLLHHRSFGS